MNGGFDARKEAVRDRVDIADVIGRVVKLGKGRKPRGKCPFHGSKSDSFAIDPDNGRARCWGCGWSGDAIQFVRDYYSLSFVDALERLEGEHGLDDLAAAPAVRQKVERRQGDRGVVDSIVFARWLWKHGRRDVAAVRAYLAGRGVAGAMLGEDRLVDIRFVGEAPIVAWEEGGKPSSVPSAPAIVALVRRPEIGLGGEWPPIGVHVTFLSPDGLTKMARQRRDGSNYPSRKMLGASAGGCVVLGRYVADAPLFVGEGLETVLSGMAIARAPAAACGIAALSLDNLQGRWRALRGALPLYDIRPDPDAAPALAFAHAGFVTGLIDADMKPLTGPVDRATGAPRGVPVIEQRRGPVVRRTISSAERSAICGSLFVQAWRGKGCRASALRPHMGQDFNDAAREAAR